MISDSKINLDLTNTNHNLTPIHHTVRFDDRVYTDGDSTSNQTMDRSNLSNSSITITIHNDNSNEQRERIVQNSSAVRRRKRSGILIRRENTITTADAPSIILSDEGLKAGRVSPFTNLPLFLSMTVRSVGIIFGDM